MSDPFFSHDKFSKIFNHIMHDVLDVQATFPPIDIAEKNDKFVMAADIPGIPARVYVLICIHSIMHRCEKGRYIP